MDSYDRSLSILVVEDNPADARLLREYLAFGPFADADVAHVTRVADGLALLTRARVDLLILDLSLPDSLGMETVQSFHRAAVDIPIIALSGASDDIARQAIRYGAQEHLHKDQLDENSLTRTIELALQRVEMRHQMREIVATVADGILVINDARNIVFANPAAQALLGDSLVGKRFSFPVEREASTIDFTDAEGERRVLEVRFAQVEWDGAEAMVASLRDMTDRKRADDYHKQLIHADRLVSVGQLASGVAHEINNPMAFVLANLSLMAKQLESITNWMGRLDSFIDGTADQDLIGAYASLNADHRPHEEFSEMTEMVADCIEGVDRVQFIVSDLNTFARADKDEIELVSLNEIADSACNMVKNEIRHRAKLVKNLAELPLLAANRGRLAQVAINLLVNATQAIELGAAHLNLIEVTTEDRGDDVVFSVRDTGKGIPIEVQERIFDPFFTTQRAGVGTGLGLSISTEIVRKYRGRIEVASRPGAGSCFEVIIPKDTGLTVPTSQKMSPLGGRSGERLRVLVVDDEPLMRDAFRRMLQSFHEVVLSGSGREALKVIEEDSAFDVILCDIMMPEVDGREFHESLELRHPKLAGRVIFCSGGVFGERLEKFMKETKNLCLKKPVPRTLLLGVIDQVATRNAKASLPPSSINLGSLR